MALSFSSGPKISNSPYHWETVIGQNRSYSEFQPWLSETSGAVQIQSKLKRFRKIHTYVALQFEEKDHSEAKIEIKIIRLPPLVRNIPTPLSFSLDVNIRDFSIASATSVFPSSLPTFEAKTENTRNTWEISNATDVDITLQEGDRILCLVSHVNIALHSWTASVTMN